MDITSRALWSLIHGMGFGGLYLLACSGLVVELARRYAPSHPGSVTASDHRFLRMYLWVMTFLAWLTVLSGTYIVYPWYRALAPAGADLADYPQRLLLSQPSTAGWHSLGMEWKEHVAWLVPIAITMALAVVTRYGRELRQHPQLRNVLLWFVVVSFAAAAVAGFFGAEIDDHAPVQGGTAFHLARGE